MRQIIRKMNFFNENVSSITFIKDLPFFAACSEDSRLILVSTKTYEIAAEYEHLMDRSWYVDCLDGKLAVAYDKGCMVLQIGSETPLFSFQKGKLLLCKSSTIQSANLKALVTKNLKDFKAVNLDCKDLGRTDLFPKQILHSPNGQFFAVFDGAEFATHKSTSGKQISFGSCRGLVWGSGNRVCILSGDSTIKTTSAAGEEIDELQVDFYIERIFGGRFLAAAGLDFVMFYDFEDLSVVGKIDASVIQVLWPPKQNQFAVSTLDGFYLLDYIDNSSEMKESDSDMSFNEDCFNVLADSEDRFSSGLWLEGVFVFLKDRTRLCLVGLGEVMNLGALPFKSHLVGYLPNQGKLYCMSNKGALFTFSLNRYLLKTIAQLNKAFNDLEEPEENEKKVLTETERQVFRKLLKTLRSKDDSDFDFLARLFKMKGFNELAFEIARDASLRFEIALDKGALREAYEICGKLDSDLKWKRLGDEAVLKGNFVIGRRAFVKAGDLNALLMLGSSLGDVDLLRYVGCKGLKLRHYSVAFCAFWVIRDLKMCHVTLLQSER